MEHPPQAPADRFGPPRTLIGSGLALWGIAVALGVVIGLIVVVGTIALAFDLDADDNTVLGVSLVAQAVANLAILGIVLLRLRGRGGGLGDFGFRPLDWGRAWWVVIAFVIASFMTIAAFDVLVDAVGLDDLRPEGNLDEDIKDSAGVFLLSAVFAILVAPISEEMFFRGLLFGGFFRDFGLAVGLLFSGILFGLVHGQITLLVPFSIIGCYLGLAYAYTRSLWGSIACHLTFNALGIIGLALS
ncbi:MAG TPA: CPBP family intramembrane glutamic endopeptidase [Dehalococcoidia bacterium]|nr:CPBP family intramembrane glutamic endopeptidase [Dehalococcoidia bacterium]